MDVSRRDFVRASAGVGGAAALGGLAGLGADLAASVPEFGAWLDRGAPSDDLYGAAADRPDARGA